jgi:branched-chain amino acid transport system substrate-binding protein
MTRRAILVTVALGLLVAACGTRVTEERADTTGTSLLERRVSLDGTAEDLGTDGATDGAGTGGTTGGTSGGTTGGTGGTTGGTGGTTGGAARAASGEPIVLGAVGTKSGLVGSALENGFRGLTVWEKWVNANGGIQGRPVRVIQVDDAGDPAKHASAVRRLILEEQVVAFIGNIAPFTFSAGLPLLEDAGIPAIGGDGGDTAWFRSPLAFPINGQTVARSRPAAKWALANLSQRKAAVLFVSEAEAPSVLAGNFVDEWRRGGGQVVVNAGVSLATPDFTGEVVEAKNRGADLMFIVLEKAACNRLFDAMRRQGYKPLVIAPACTIDNALGHKDLTTDRFFGSHAAKPVKGGAPGEDEAIAAGRRFDPNLALDGAFMFGWLAGKLLEAALAQPGAEVSPAGIIAALERLPATTLGGLTPSQSWPRGAHPEGRCGWISRFDGTQLVIQTPEPVCA